MKTITKVTLATLIEQSNIPASLIRAVVRQMGGWQSFTESAPDICRGGIDGGFHGFIYHADTLPFTKRNRAAILELAKSQADDFGQDVIEMVAGFNCLGGRTVQNRMSGHGSWIPDPQREQERRKILGEYTESVARCLYGGRTSDDDTEVLNALAWYAGEEVAREYCRLTEQD